MKTLEETVGLFNEQWQRKSWILGENLRLLELEELYWFNRCHENWILKGDLNTSYFHLIANGRKIKTQC